MKFETFRDETIIQATNVGEYSIFSSIDAFSGIEPNVWISSSSIFTSPQQKVAFGFEWLGSEPTETIASLEIKCNKLEDNTGKKKSKI